MSDASQLEQLLDQWEDAREQGTPRTAEELCEKCPQFLPQLKKRITAIEAFDQCVDKAPFDDVEQTYGTSATPGSQSTPGNGASPSLLYQSNLVNLVVHERGGLGVVYRGVDEKLNRNVAIKFIQPRHAKNENLTQRFIQEAEITGRLEHPGVVPVYAIGQSDVGQPFYSMRFIRGESLDSQLKRFHHELQSSALTRSQQRLRQRQLLNSIVSVSRTIGYAHTRGIVHRDIKPQNIMLGKYGETLVVDWGLALPIERDSRFRVTDETTLRPVLESDLTHDTAEGTPVYMSPEQAVGHPIISPASDIYSLGVTLYKVLTGKLAFDGANAIEVRSRIIAGEFEPPSVHDPQLPKPLESICLKAMALEPHERYETATEIADDLESWLADNRVTAHRYSRRERLWRWCRRHQGLIAGIAASLLVLSAAAFVVSGYSINQARLERETTRQIQETLRIARRNQADSVSMTCRVASKSVRLTVEASVAAIEELARSPAMLEQLFLTADNLTPQQQTKRQNALESLLANARCDDETNLIAISWFALDSSGLLLARSSDSASSIKLNQPMWMRPYFHGRLRSLPRDLPVADRPAPIQKTIITPLFIGKGKGWQLSSIATPVKDKDQRVIGVIGMTLRVGRFDPADQLGLTNTQRMVSLVETRGEWAGRLIHHPGLKAEDQEEETPAKVASATVDQAVLDELRMIDRNTPAPAVLDEYVDPIEPTVGYRWLAYASPVRFRSRQYGWLENGWYLIVQDQPIASPIDEPRRRIDNLQDE